MLGGRKENGLLFFLRFLSLKIDFGGVYRMFSYVGIFFDFDKLKRGANMN